MSNLQIFTYSDKQVRTILKDGNPWWVLKDVCDILELSNNRMVADRLEEDEVSQTYVTDNLGRQQETTIINESGLYNVILRSDKHEAKAFKRWITHEVLPAIRKTGGYSMVPKSFAEALRLAADLEEERQKLLPKAQGYDYLMNAEGTVTIGEAAKLLDIPGFGPQKIFKLLIVEEIIFKRGDSYLPYQQYRSHFIVKQNPVQRGDFIKERTQLYLDMAGLDWLAKLLVKRGYEVNYTHQRALAKV